MKQENFNAILTHFKIILDNIALIDLSLLTKMKKIYAISGKNTQNKTLLVVFSFTKSKILLKNAQNLEKIFFDIKKHSKTTYNESIFFHQALICSKAKNYLNSKEITTYAFV